MPRMLQKEKNKALQRTFQKRSPKTHLILRPGVSERIHLKMSDLFDEDGCPTELKRQSMSERMTG